MAHFQVDESPPAFHEHSTLPNPLYPLSQGIILDPVYTGKALHGWLRDAAAAPEAWQGRRVLFLHTGGLLGTYDKAQELLPLLQADDAVHRMQGL